MAIFSKKSAFARQFIIFYKNEDFQKAYELGKEFTAKYPDEMLAHFLLAKSAYLLGRYDEAKTEARKAFNRAANDDDLIVCALLISCASFQLGEHTQAYDVLKSVEFRKPSDDVEHALFVLALAMDDVDLAMKHMDRLFAINEKLAINLILGSIGM